MHHADAAGDGIGRRSERHWSTGYLDRAFVRLVEAVHNIHEGAFTGAILAEQTENLASVQL